MVRPTPCTVLDLLTEQSYRQSNQPSLVEGHCKQTSSSFSLKKPFLTSPSGGETDHPPTSPTGDGRYPFNHMGANNRIEVGENFGSPRKKPRKQNV